MEWVEVKDHAQQPEVHRTAPGSVALRGRNSELGSQNNKSHELTLFTVHSVFTTTTACGLIKFSEPL